MTLERRGGVKSEKSKLLLKKAHGFGALRIEKRVGVEKENIFKKVLKRHVEMVHHQLTDALTLLS